MDKSTSAPKSNKVFVGGISRDTTDAGFASYFSRFGEVKECTIMRDRVTRASRGFGFVTFADQASVDKVLATECDIDDRIVDCKLAVPQDTVPRTEETHRTRKIFVGGLGPATTQEELKDHFSQYGTVINAVIMMDSNSGRSRGFGFVTFDSEDAVASAVSRSHTIGSRPVEIKKAMPRGMVETKDTPAYGGFGFGGYPPYGGGSEFDFYGAQYRQGASRGGDGGRPKIFVGGLNQSTTEGELKDHFGQFGGVVSTQIMMDTASNRSRGFGFVTFDSEDSVSNVLARNHTIGGKMVECKRARPKTPGGPPVPAPVMRPQVPPFDGGFPGYGAPPAYGAYGRGYDAGSYGGAPNRDAGYGAYGAGGYASQPRAQSKNDRSFHPYNRYS